MGKLGLDKLIVDNEKNRKTSGIVLVIIAVVFMLAGIGFFVASNWSNLYAEEVSATVVGASSVTYEDGSEHVMLSLVYKVGNEMVETTYSYPGVYDEDMVSYDGYYDSRDPKSIVTVEWTFVPLWVILFGILILLPGLYYLGVIKLPQPSYKKVRNADDKIARLDELKEQVENSLFPSVAALIVGIFGLVMGILNGAIWTWVVAAIGFTFAVVFCYDFYGPLKEFLTLRKALKYRGSVVNESLEETLKNTAPDSDEEAGLNKKSTNKSKSKKLSNKEIAEEVAKEAADEEDDFEKWEKEHYHDEKF